MKLKTLTAVSSLALAVSMATPAFAQDNGNSSNNDNKKAEDHTASIVVTATFRATQLQDTPIAITAVNSEMLEKRGQTDIAQVAAQAPNVTLRPQPQNGGAGLIAFIRGIGQTDFNYALEPGVGVYVDDVYIPTLSSSLLQLMDVNRVEILRGPQGTLAGKNAIGGAIKLFSQKPKGDGSGSLSVGYGSYNDISVRGMMDFALSDNLAVRVTGMSEGRDGYVTIVDYGNSHPDSNVLPTNGRGWSDINQGYQHQGGISHLGARIGLDWKPTDKLEVYITGDYTRQNDESLPVVLMAAGHPSVAPNPATEDPGTPFNPTVPWAAVSLGSDFSTIPWLVGKDGNAVPLGCQFVPAGPNSCDTGRTLPAGIDPRFVSYSTFQDGISPTLADGSPNAQAPYKPYFAVPITFFKGWGVQGHLTYDFSDNLQLLYIGSYRAYITKWGQDQDGTPIPVAQLDNRMSHDSWSQEVRLNFGSSSNLIEGTVGGFYMKQSGEYNARVDLNYVDPTIDFIHGPDTTPSTTKALFGTVTLHPTMDLSITGGVRYTKDEKTYTYFRSNPDHTLPNGGACFGPPGPPITLYSGGPNCLLAGLYGISGTYKGDRWDYRGVINYRWSDQFMTYASISTGYMGGGINPRPFVGDQALPFNPETLTTYEVGFKADLFDRLVRINGAAFYNKFKDIILTKLVCPESSLPNPCLRPANIGAADMKGFELETSIYPVEGLSIDGSLSYLHFKYTSPTEHALPWDNTSPLVLANTAIPADGITPYTPTLTYSFGIQYDFDLSSGTLSTRFDGTYQSKMYTASENTSWSEVPGYFLGNARVTYKTDNDDWELSLEIKNLFDKYYMQTVSDATASVGVQTGVPGMPRTWQLTVKRNF